MNVWKSGGKVPKFLTSGQDGGEWSASFPAALLYGKEAIVPTG
jgi:hypothetical protein